MSRRLTRHRARGRNGVPGLEPRLSAILPWVPRDARGVCSPPPGFAYRPGVPSRAVLWPVSPGSGPHLDVLPWCLRPGTWEEGSVWTVTDPGHEDRCGKSLSQPRTLSDQGPVCVLIPRPQ